MNQQRPEVSKQPYSLPIIALVLSILGSCVCPLGIVGVVLAIISLVRIKNEPQLSGSGLAIAALIIPAAMVPLIGILAAVAIPNFIRFQARAKQAECKMNLKSAFTAERALMQEKERYFTDPQDVGFMPERGNRYAYVFDRAGPIIERGQEASTPAGRIIAVDTFKYSTVRMEQVMAGLPKTLAGEAVGLTGVCPDCNFTLACVGDIDNDPGMDVWSISSKDRTAADGTPIPAGLPYNDVNDVTR